jgi:hypothetical protein
MDQLTERGKLLTRPDESQNKDDRVAISKLLPLTTSRVDFSSRLLKSECPRLLPFEPQKSFNIVATHRNVAD